MNNSNSKKIYFTDRRYTNVLLEYVGPLVGSKNYVRVYVIEDDGKREFAKGCHTVVRKNSLNPYKGTVSTQKPKKVEKHYMPASPNYRVQKSGIMFKRKKT